MRRNRKVGQYRDRILKESVAAVYETDTFSSFLIDALHPGGIQLTRRIAEIAHLDTNSRVLDIACGKGGTPFLLAQEYGCNVIGIDLSEKMIALARSRSNIERLNGKVEFIVADAEELPFIDATFDAVVSECSFSILPNKQRAASELNRVLEANGRLVITDITIREKIPSEIQNQLSLAPRASLAPFPCVAGARPSEDYVALFEQAGFRNPYIEDHSLELKKLGYQMGITFGGWEEFINRLSLELPPGSKGTEKPTPSVPAYRKLFTRGRLGYTLIKVSKP